jgi:hypothetical protein
VRFYKLLRKLTVLFVFDQLSTAGRLLSHHDELVTSHIEADREFLERAKTFATVKLGDRMPGSGVAQQLRLMAHVGPN